MQINRINHLKKIRLSKQTSSIIAFLTLIKYNIIWSHGGKGECRTQNITDILIVKISLFLIKNMWHLSKCFWEETKMAAWDYQCLLQETVCELCLCLKIAGELGGYSRTTILNSSQKCAACICLPCICNTPSSAHNLACTVPFDNNLMRFKNALVVNVNEVSALQKPDVSLQGIDK